MYLYWRSNILLMQNRGRGGNFSGYNYVVSMIRRSRVTLDFPKHNMTSSCAFDGLFIITIELKHIGTVASQIETNGLNGRDAVTSYINDVIK